MIAYLEFPILSKYICNQKYVIIKVARHYLTNNLLDYKHIYTYYVFFVKAKGEAENENSNRR